MTEQDFDITHPGPSREGLADTSFMLDSGLP